MLWTNIRIVLRQGVTAEQRGLVRMHELTHSRGSAAEALGSEAIRSYIAIKQNPGALSFKGRLYVQSDFGKLLSWGRRTGLARMLTRWEQGCGSDKI